MRSGDNYSVGPVVFSNRFANCETSRWLGDDYLILFADSELASASERYAISKWLPGYTVVGLRGWDDLIVKDGVGQTHSIPAVPLDLQYMAAFVVPGSKHDLEDDQPRYAGKIKWYVKPIVFGGEVNNENTIWINHTEHAGLVNFWNRLYWHVKDPSADGSDIDPFGLRIWEDDETP